MKTLMVAAMAAGAISCLGFGDAVAAGGGARLQSAVYAANAGEPTARLQNVYYVRVYKCTARSRTGSYGYWTAPALSTARRGALTQCAIRTPRGVLCRITSCR
jgi:hypothetical protein